MTVQEAHALALRFMADALATSPNVSPAFSRAAHDELTRQAEEAEDIALGGAALARKEQR